MHAHHRDKGIGSRSELHLVHKRNKSVKRMHYDSTQRLGTAKDIGRTKLIGHRWSFNKCALELKSFTLHKFSGCHCMYIPRFQDGGPDP